MKVLHVYKSYFPEKVGGVENFIDQLIVAGVPHGINSEVLTLTNEKKISTLEMNGYKVHRIPQLFELFSTPISFRVFFTFLKLVKDIDVIHFHFPWPMADALYFVSRILFRKKIPYIITYHSDIVKQKTILKLYTPLMNLFLSHAQKIISTSPNYAKTSTNLTKFSEKVQFIPIGLDEKRYTLDSPQRLEYWRGKFGGKFFLFIGVMRYYKGLDYLIEAAKGINTPIVIVGSGDPIESLLKEKVLQSKIQNVHFLNSISEADKIALLTLCYAVVLPSHLRSEAFGISLLEGAMFGKPLVSCEIGTGTTYINIDKETGLVVPPADAKALHNALQYLLHHPEETEKMGQSARTRYLNHFQIENMTEKYRTLYNTVLTETKAATHTI